MGSYPRPEVISGPRFGSVARNTSSPGGVAAYTPLAAPKLEGEDEAEKARKEAEEKRIANLSAVERYVEECWQEARNAKNLNVYDTIVDGFRMREGVYSPQEFATYSQNNRSTVYVNMVKDKCRAMESKLREIFFPSKDYSWTIMPTPLPELSSDVLMGVVGEVMMEEKELQRVGIIPTQAAMESRAGELNEQLMRQTLSEAEERAERMERLMRDQLAEGNWEDAVMEMLFFFVSSPAGMLRGPIKRERKKMVWRDGKAQEQMESCIEWEALNPLDVFPLPRAKSGDDGYFVRHFYSMSDLIGMSNMTGANTKNIHKILEAYGRSGFRTSHTEDYEKDLLENRSNSQTRSGMNEIETLQFVGPVLGDDLRTCGLEVAPEDGKKVFSADIYTVDSIVIYAAFDEGECRPKLYKAFFDGQPNGWWGEGVPQVLEPYQDMSNTVARALENNVGVASGPQVVINDVERLSDESYNEIEPWRLWSFFKDPGAMTDRKAMDFYQPSMLAGELVGVLNFLDQKASEIIGVPEPPYKGLTGAAKGTASGLSIAVGQGNKNLRFIASKVAQNIIRPALENLYKYNMKYSRDMSVKGDLMCVVKGFEAEIAKEQLLMRAVELLGMTANPTDSMATGLIGRAKMLKAVAKLMGLDSLSDIFPDDEQELAKKVMENAQMMQLIMGGAPPGDGAQVGSPTQMNASGTAAEGGQDASIYTGASAVPRNFARAQ